MGDRRTKPAQRPQRHATSYVEVLLSTLLVSAVLIGALKTTGAAARTTHATADLDRRTRYALELLAEAAAQPYSDPEEDNPSGNFGVETDEPSPAADRSAFDDLDDYDEWEELGPLRERDGTALPNTDRWARKVDVRKVRGEDFTSFRNDNAADQGARRITVTVTSPRGETVVEAIRTEGGVAERPSGTAVRQVGGVLIELQAGSATSSAATATPNLPLGDSP